MLKDRAQRQAETRQRIIQSTVALHLELGPAATQVREIARRAGVQRLTVYNHFPEEGVLLAACSAHWRALHPAPDPESWLTATDGSARLRLALRRLYSWYRETEPMMANVLRDAQTMPALHRVLESGLLRYLDRVPEILVEPFQAKGKRAERIVRAAHAAVDISFWRALKPLGDKEAAELAAGLVELAANR